MTGEHSPDEKKGNTVKKEKNNKFRKFNEKEVNKKHDDDKFSPEVTTKAISTPAWTLQSDAPDKSQYLKDFPELKSRKSKSLKGGNKNLSKSEDMNKRHVKNPEDAEGIHAPSTSNTSSVATLTQTLVLTAAPKNKMRKSGSDEGTIQDPANPAKPVIPAYRNPYKKKRTDPTFFTLEDALELKTRRIKLAVKSRGVKRKFHRDFSKDKLSGNILDASNPTRNKGKHREFKRKRLSNLKSLIIKERIIKRICLEKTSLSAPDLSALLENLDFKVEIQKYVKDRIQSQKKVRGSWTKDTTSENPSEILQTESSRLQVNKATKESSEKIELHVSSALNAQKPETLPVGTPVKDLAGLKTPFSSRMREYCENLVTPELNAAVRDLVKGLIDLQDRAFSRDPIKARSKKRHVEGLKEVKKYLTLKRVKLVVIPSDLEKLFMQGTITDLIEELKKLAASHEVPCVYAMNRYSLGRCAKKSVPVSAFAVLNYDGLEDRYKEVMNKWEEAKKGLEEKLNGEKPERDETSAQVTSKLLCVLRENWPSQQSGQEAKKKEKDQAEEPDEDVSGKSEADDISEDITSKLMSVVISPGRSEEGTSMERKREEEKDSKRRV